MELYACFHSAECFSALDAVLEAAPGATLHVVPQDGAERGLAVRLAQLDAENPAASREVWRRLRDRWKAEGALGVGPAHGWASPEATGVPAAGIEAFESVVDAALAAYARAGGTGGPLVLRGGRPVAPGSLAP
ncbi:hypothetical protein ACM64Y_17850 [Novispirillum sp. DQ9]|uniref:hypothetical protein n=1 Tax=Novispirillum sp. DQ9 TaxID=3398612 RepID=UPI003C7AB573